jgi:type IV pilus assembly protein PilQ
LGVFAAVGIALALYVGFSLRPPPAHGTVPDLSHSSREAGAPQRGDAEREADVPVAPDEGKVESTPWLASRPEISDSIPPRIRMPLGPIVVEPHPPSMFQVPSARQNPGLADPLPFSRDVAVPMISQAAPRVGTTAPEPIPPPASAEDRLPAGLGATTESRNHASRITSGEGDDQLEIDIQNEDIRVVLETLSKEGNLNILASKSVEGPVSATLRGVDIESALDAILKLTGYVAKREGDLIYVGTPQDFESMEQSLDMVGTRVYRPNYVTAAELEALIQPLLTADTGKISVSSPSEVGIAPDAENAGGDAYAGGEAVVVRDYEAVLAQIDQVVAEIDTRPMQVAIEAMILTVSLDDGNDFGVSFELLRDKNNIRLGWGMPLDSLAGPTFEFDEGGLKFGFLDSSLGAFLDALESIGDTNVIATPRLMVLNKHRAEIHIGEELGYVSTTTATESASTQTVEFLKVGARLCLRPFIASDGLIRMEAHPELSTGSVEEKGEFTLPNKETTQVTTNIMVRDGCTVVIGGLMREELEKTASQIPFFGSLPLVGPAFRNVSETLERREILVLITPHIVYEPETCQEGEQLACEFERRQAVYREKMSPLGKRHIGRRYLRMSQSAWATGDRRAALRFAEMSIHFDPANRAAIDLRSRIWLGQPAGAYAREDLVAGQPITAPLDGAVIAPWVLDELESQPSPQPELSHPLDRGRPGRHIDIKQPRTFR